MDLHWLCFAGSARWRGKIIHGVGSLFTLSALCSLFLQRDLSCDFFEVLDYKLIYAGTVYMYSVLQRRTELHVSRKIVTVQLL